MYATREHANERRDSPRRVHRVVRVPPLLLHARGSKNEVDGNYGEDRGEEMGFLARSRRVCFRYSLALRTLSCRSAGKATASFFCCGE